MCLILFAARAHPGQVVPRQPHAAQHVRLEEAEPVGVGDLGKGLGLEDTDVVDEDRDLRNGGRQRRAAFARAGGEQCSPRGLRPGSGATRKL